MPSGYARALSPFGGPTLADDFDSCCTSLLPRHPGSPDAPAARQRMVIATARRAPLRELERPSYPMAVLSPLAARTVLAARAVPVRRLRATDAPIVQPHQPIPQRLVRDARLQGELPQARADGSRGPTALPGHIGSLSRTLMACCTAARHDRAGMNANRFQPTRLRNDPATSSST